MRVERQSFIYILGNWTGEVLYTGVTASLKRRVFEHKKKLVQGFTRKYNVDRLLYYEVFSDIRDAIAREKQLKAGPRRKKVALIDAFNPNWRDLYDAL